MAPNRFIFIMYEPNPSSTFLVSYYYPKNNQCISTIPLGAPARSIAYEWSHQAQKFFNENRGSLLPLDVKDELIISDQLIKDKLASVVPYVRAILLK